MVRGYQRAGVRAISCADWIVTAYTELKVGAPRCGVPAPCRRGTGASPSDQFVALGTECSAAERGGDGAARHPYLGFFASRGNAHEISGLVVMNVIVFMFMTT